MHHLEADSPRRGRPRGAPSARRVCALAAALALHPRSATPAGALSSRVAKGRTSTSATYASSTERAILADAQEDGDDIEAMTSANLFDLLLHLAVFTSVVSANFASSTAPINSAMQEPEGLFGTLFPDELLGTGLPFHDFVEGMQIIIPATANMHNVDQSAQWTIEDNHSEADSVPPVRRTGIYNNHAQCH